ncbi:hypothetical protein EMIHUDRAFT_234055 [Emiliania huxleyi CCMP1516]|uniref:Uncharacterized protein n=2 Tax=Emiliania huxleyi TaxID=2903 RepID=A0A0D3K039_EMIH1|nr:hypothetical protein EMIHUDRAFT_234055 [Emiliania huxleyi CCMP1516]EOD29124.1 hypothetical protein EMIHUDRAFT_234055 [Emiliania huxleyi CCMP1516]|eukprot:XP_005781553.1 hypothetical protein EMIHUDRAFT_234055 [Emiliania huxleyi CCMP1516]
MRGRGGLASRAACLSSSLAPVRLHRDLLNWGAPAGSGFTAIYSTGYAFAALKADGSISAWGDSRYGGSGAPAGSGFTAIYSTEQAFAALKEDGSISAWGDSSRGGSGAPTGSGFTAIYSTNTAFAALKADGSISGWGDSSRRENSFSER